MSPIIISEVTFVAARPEQVAYGMLGHVTFVLNGTLKLDGITLRRTREGKPVLSFPCRRDRAGRDHPYMRPLSNGCRATIEQHVFAELGIGEDER